MPTTRRAILVAFAEERRNMIFLAKKASVRADIGDANEMVLTAKLARRMTGTGTRNKKARSVHATSLEERSV